MLAVGIDPGTARTGYGFVRETDHGFEVVDYGVITTVSTDSDETRLEQLFDRISSLLDLHQPDSGAVEKLFFSRNITSAIHVSQARGVVLLGLKRHGVKISEYTPMQVKQAICGYGGAEKRQIQEMVKVILNLESIPKPDDAADALAIALCHLQSYKLNSLAQ
ncbi:MAG TPA: crossover junction endodeoxyribonuclease RuvC [Bellilinea sp.]|nr:crossover junction endodeoxyribonuclease RuvC [Bellilinea sp.]